jgi:hypothetical protein
MINSNIDDLEKGYPSDDFSFDSVSPMKNQSSNIHKVEQQTIKKIQHKITRSKTPWKLSNDTNLNEGGD